MDFLTQSDDIENKFQLEELDVNEKKCDCEIPESAIGKLMYYLHSICTVLNLNESDIKRIETYKNYKMHTRMSFHDKHKILKLCKLLGPKALLNQCIFQVPELCDNENSNHFYRFTADESNIMVFGDQWLQSYYYAPKQELIEELKKHKNKTDFLMNDCKLS